MVLMNIIWFIVFSLILVRSSTYLVRSIIKLASILKVTEFALSFIIMAFATSVPELFVGITAAIRKSSELTLGTIIGSNIADIALVFGIAILLSKGIKIKREIIKKHALNMLLIAAIPVLLMLDGGLSRIDAILLLMVFVGYMVWIFKKEKEYTKTFKEGHKTQSVREAVKQSFTHAFIFLLSLGVVFLSAHFIVKYASLLAIDFSVPPILIGLVLVGIGTSLPELAFEIKSALIKRPELVLGNIIGSVIINSTLILGVSALIFPITADFSLFLTSSLFMLIVLFLFVMFARSKQGFTQRKGIILLILYVVFLVVEFGIAKAV